MTNEQPGNRPANASNAGAQQTGAERAANNPSVQNRARAEERKVVRDAAHQQRINQVVSGDPEPTAEAEESRAQVQETMNEATSQGYIGETPDDTPNENYTVAGVTANAPRPDAQATPMSSDETR